MAKVTLKNIKKKYPKAENYTVDNFNLDIEDHEFMIFVGPSGCGKSTVLRMIAGLETITDGELMIGDKLVNNLPGAKRSIAMVFQNYALYPHMTVRQNMSFSLEMNGMDKDEIIKKVEAAALKLDLGDLLDRKPSEMSGGQCQRVAIGRAIVRDPKVFLMDEPLSNLDAKLRVKMRAEISKLHTALDTTTFIYVTHDQVEAMTMGTRIAVMHAGIIQQCDSPEVLYDSPINKFVAGFIGSPAMNFFDCVVKKEDNGIYLEMENCFKIKVPEDREEKIISYKEKHVWLGIRPQHIYPDDTKDIEVVPGNTLKAKAVVVEPLGSEKFVLFETKSGFEFTARFDPRVSVKKCDEFNLTFDLSLSHIFDSASELNITL